jgi:hypothetical protein
MTTPYQDINISRSNCIKPVEHLGSTSYHNICNGTLTEVPWGINHYAKAVVGTVCILTFITLASIFIFCVVRDSRQ